MECSICGGLALWVGPIYNLTHTECQACGAINSQVMEDDGEDDEEEA